MKSTMDWIDFLPYIDDQLYNKIRHNKVMLKQRVYIEYLVENFEYILLGKEI